PKRCWQVGHRVRSSPHVRPAARDGAPQAAMPSPSQSATRAPELNDRCPAGAHNRSAKTQTPANSATRIARKLRSRILLWSPCCDCEPTRCELTRCELTMSAHDSHRSILGCVLRIFLQRLSLHKYPSLH